MNNLVRIIFFGNVFYGLCAVIMCMETNLVNGFSRNVFPFYLLIFFGTWIYYTMIYIRSAKGKSGSARTNWYATYLPQLKKILAAVLVIQSLLIILFAYRYWREVVALSWSAWLLIILIIIAAALYTFRLPMAAKKIRQVGWLKPIIVGLSWAGVVTIFPLLAWHVQYTRPVVVDLPLLLFALQNFLFITTLAIIFDVKDHKSDLKHNLKTYPALFGVANTYRWIIIPLVVLTLVITLAFQFQRNFSPAQSSLQLLPYLLLLLITILYQKPRSIMYYLVVVDGLMMLKAICGIISVEIL